MFFKMSTLTSDLNLRTHVRDDQGAPWKLHTRLIQHAIDAPPLIKPGTLGVSTQRLCTFDHFKVQELCNGNIGICVPLMYFLPVPMSNSCQAAPPRPCNKFSNF